MFIIIGTKRTNKVIAKTQEYTCPQCRRAHPFEIVRAASWIALFWIPVIPYSSKHYMRCPVCGSAVEITREQAQGYLA